MTTGRGNTFDMSLEFPAQVVVPMGLGGENLAIFRAPTKWVFANAFYVAGAAWASILTPPANKSLRIYRVSITVHSPAAYPTTVALSLAGNTIQYYPVYNVAAPAHFSEEFSPVGISQNVGSALQVQVYTNNTWVAVFIQYSLEPYGAQNDGD